MVSKLRIIWKQTVPSPGLMLGDDAGGGGGLLFSSLMLSSLGANNGGDENSHINTAGGWGQEFPFPRAVSSSADGTLRIWNLDTFEALAVLDGV